MVMNHGCTSISEIGLSFPCLNYLALTLPSSITGALLRSSTKSSCRSVVSRIGARGREDARRARPCGLLFHGAVQVLVLLLLCESWPRGEVCGMVEWSGKGRWARDIDSNSDGDGDGIMDDAGGL